MRDRITEAVGGDATIDRVKTCVNEAALQLKLVSGGHTQKRVEFLRKEALIREEAHNRVSEGIAMIIFESLPLDEAILEELGPEIQRSTTAFVGGLFKDGVLNLKRCAVSPSPLVRSAISSFVTEGVTPKSKAPRSTISGVVMEKAKTALKGEIEAARLNQERISELESVGEAATSNDERLPVMRRTARPSRTVTIMGKLIHESCKKVSKETGKLNRDMAIGEAVVSFCTLEVLNTMGIIPPGSGSKVYDMVVAH
jgi:hypothetical protein